jgi:hypothetical protein
LLLSPVNLKEANDKLDGSTAVLKNYREWCGVELTDIATAKMETAINCRTTVDVVVKVERRGTLG